MCYHIRTLENKIESWDGNFNIQIKKNASWYNAIELANILLEIKNGDLGKKESRITAARKLKNIAFTLKGLGIDGTQRFPPAICYLCDIDIEWYDLFTKLATFLSSSLDRLYNEQSYQAETDLRTFIKTILKL